MRVTPTPKRIAALRRRLKYPAGVYFDLDGTLFTKQWLIELMLVCAKRYPSKRDTVEPLRRELEIYKEQRTYDYEPVMRAAVKAIDTFFVGLRQASVQRIAARLVEDLGSQTYLFPRMLIRHYAAHPGKERGPIIGITGSPRELAEPFGERMGFDLIYGVEYEVRNGRYTGERNARTIMDKRGVMEEVADQMGLDLRRSIALGDTMTDFPVLERVGTAFAVNPDLTLLTQILKGPNDGIIWVNDRQKNGVSFFTAKDGRFVQRDQQEVVPAYLRLPRLPGLTPLG